MLEHYLQVEVNCQPRFMVFASCPSILFSFAFLCLKSPLQKKFLFRTKTGRSNCLGMSPPPGERTCQPFYLVELLCKWDDVSILSSRLDYLILWLVTTRFFDFIASKLTDRDNQIYMFLDNKSILKQISLRFLICFIQNSCCASGMMYQF